MMGGAWWGREKTKEGLVTLNRKMLHSARNLAEPIRLMNSLKYMIGFDDCQTVRKKIGEVAAEMTYTRLFKLF